MPYAVSDRQRSNPSIDSNHLIKTEEFIGDDLHKVHIKSAPFHIQPER